MFEARGSDVRTSLPKQLSDTSFAENQTKQIRAIFVRAKEPSIRLSAQTNNSMSLDTASHVFCYILQIWAFLRRLNVERPRQSRIAT